MDTIEKAEAEFSERLGIHARLCSELTIATTEVDSLLADGDANPIAIADAQGRRASLTSAIALQERALDRVRDALAAARAANDRKATVARLRELAQECTAKEAQKESAAKAVIERLGQYEKIVLAALEAQIGIRAEFLSIAGDDVIAYASEMESQGVDLSAIRKHWIDTESSAIDRAPLPDTGRFAGALAAAIAPALQERIAAQKAAVRIAREQRRRER